MCTVSPAKVTEISVPVRYFMPCARAAARGAVLAADLVVVGQRPQLDAVGRGARRQRFGLSVPSETTEWQCRSALSKGEFKSTGRL